MRAVHVPKRENPIVNRLNKTKVERQVDHEQERIERVKKENTARRAAAQQKVRLSFATRWLPGWIVGYRCLRGGARR